MTAQPKFWSDYADMQADVTSLSTYEPRHEQTCLWHMRTTKAQISLRIRTVWLAPLLFAAWII